MAPIVERLIERAAADLMIGFFFRAADLEQVKRHELELAQTHLGGPARYTGRPLPEAHASHPISKGHFERRLKILADVLAEANVPTWIAEQWLSHDRAQEAAVVTTQCNPKRLPNAPTEP
ncbi:MAG: group 1 truncated hemoglobin [Planctomycetes bacterium]|nr:group 1 truncated hemoglobin [Planctomycetota bacterium]